MKILNLASGRIFEPLDVNEKVYTMINVDRLYRDIKNSDYPELQRKYLKNKLEESSKKVFFLDNDIDEFLQKCVIEFDKICIYRYFEHVSWHDISYFIYQISEILKVGGILDIIVPDYDILSKKILDLDPERKSFEEEFILLNSEVVNEKYDPHQIITTKKIVKHFLELEGRFKVITTKRPFHFDGRDIYMRVIAKRI